MQTSKHQQQKTTQPTFGSLFAGVGGFDLGFEAAGYTCGFQVEWDRNCQQVLAYHWPDVPRWEDVSDVNGADLPPVDVITYGFPCQDLSVAGKRAGLDGNRSGLFFEAVRIITEMREATNGRYPTWAVAENVGGLLNADRGYAMARVLDELAEAGALVVEWATLDAQFFGVPQRRRRVFVASCFDPATARRCPDPLFPVAQSGSRDFETSRKTGQDIAGTLGRRTNGPGSTDVDGHGAYIPAVFSTLNTNDGTKWGSDQWVDEGKALVVPTQDGTTNAGPSVFAARGFARYEEGMTVLRAAGGDLGGGSEALVLSDQTEDWPGGVQPTVGPLTTGSPGRIRGSETTDSGHIVATHEARSDFATRRLTPTECERLMGWPDGHTLHRADGKTNADGTRYKMCGNGVVAHVARWVARHLSGTLTENIEGE